VVNGRGYSTSFHKVMNVVRRIVPEVLQQHIDEIVHLRLMRTIQVVGSKTRLRHLGRLDERLCAHMDGLLVAGEGGFLLTDRILELPSKSVMFTAAAAAIQLRQPGRLDSLFALCKTSTKLRAGLSSAFGWVSAYDLQGVASHLLTSSDSSRRFVGLTTCAFHRVDPGTSLVRFIDDSDVELRARAWRTAGEIGKRQLVSTAAAAITDDEPACRFWAAWAAVLLGDKHAALDVVASVAAVPGSFRARAFQLVLQAKSAQSAHHWLASLSKEPANHRWLIRGAGLVGDPAYVPWLIAQMADDKTTRLAGEAFSLITGLDLAWLDLEVKPPQNFESGPSDDPNDPNVDMDEDDGLPWPDAAKIEAWWHANSSRFQPGVRYFMGQPLNKDHCLRVLKEGFQRQRIAAAIYLSLLNPGTPLFEWRAPARRQRRLLAEMH